MPFGMTPSDKKSYKESKRRRKQALMEEKTGRIFPYGSAKRKVIIAACIVIAVFAAAAGAYFLILFSADSGYSAQKSTQETVESSEELLTVVNKQNPLEFDYVPELLMLDGFKVNSLMYDDLSQMLDDAQSDGVELKINSVYVSYDEQKKLYDDTLSELLQNPDYTEVRAQAYVQKLVPMAGQSEAQTGLLVDFDVSDSGTALYIERNCISYGFIQRYPDDKESVTSMYGSESLYRYVGKDNAVKMRSYNMCLEEYVDYLSAQNSDD